MGRWEDGKIHWEIEGGRGNLGEIPIEYLDFCAIEPLNDEYSGLASSSFGILGVGLVYTRSGSPAVFLGGWLYSLVIFGSALPIQSAIE